MEQEFRLGDTVQLKSGGPKMTIEAIGDHSFSTTPEIKANCVWFDGTKKQESLFNVAAVMHHKLPSI